MSNGIFKFVQTNMKHLLYTLNVLTTIIDRIERTCGFSDERYALGNGKDPELQCLLKVKKDLR